MSDERKQQHGSSSEEAEPMAPARLIAALRSRSLRGARVDVPPSVDAAVMEQAREKLGQNPPVRIVIALPRWLAAAAVVLAGAGVSFLLFRAATPGTGTASSNEDIDHNGEVDMLDAFALARKIQSGPVADLHYDLNGDGLVDQHDIDWIAGHAVKLHKS